MGKWWRREEQRQQRSQVLLKRSMEPNGSRPTIWRFVFIWHFQTDIKVSHILLDQFCFLIVLKFTRLFWPDSKTGSTFYLVQPKYGGGKFRVCQNSKSTSEHFLLLVFFQNIVLWLKYFAIWPYCYMPNMVIWPYGHARQKKASGISLKRELNVAQL